MLGEDHPDTLGSASNLAVDLRELGEHERARQLDEDTLARRRRVLGDDHPHTLISAGNLAVDLRELGDHEHARQLHDDTLVRSRRVLGEDHPDTLRSASNLAVDLRELGDHEHARQLHDDTMARRRRVLGGDHPHVLTSADNLHARGEHVFAHQLCKETLDRQSDSLNARSRPRLERITNDGELDTVTRAFAMAGYDLDSSDDPGVLISGDGLVVATDAVDTLGVVGTRLRSGGIAYVVHAGRLPEGAEQQLDRLRVDGKLIVPLSLRALDAALSDGNVGNLLADLRNYAARDNLFDTKNALVDDRHFFGRDAALTIMGSLTSRDEHILLTGLRKVGKTSLLNIFRQHLVRYPVCHVDLQLYDRNAEDWHLAIFAQALRAFDMWARQRRSPWEVEQKSPATATAFGDAVDMRLDKLGPDGRGLRLVLLLDEVERVFPVEGEEEASRRWVLATQSLRALTQASQRRLVIVAADLRPILNRVNLMSEGQTNPFFQFFHEMPIPLFDLDATREMITGIGAAMSIEVDDDFVRALYRLTGGHPAFARSFAAEASRHRSSPRHLTPLDLDQALQAMLESGAIDAFLQSNIWDPMTFVEKQVVTACAHGEAILEPTDAGSDHKFTWRQAVVNLRQHGLLDGDLVTMDILAQWIREQQAGIFL